MSDGDFGGGDDGGFGGDGNFGEGGMSFGGDASASTAFGDVSFGDEGSSFGAGDYGDGLGGGSNFGLGLGGFFGGEALGDALGNDGLASFADLGAYGTASTPFGDISLTDAPSSFGQQALSFLANLAKSKASQALGIPTSFMNIIANLAKGNTKGAAANIGTALMGPLGPLAGLVSAITGAPTIGQSIANAPGMAPGESPVDTGPGGGVLGALGPLGMGLYGMQQARALARMGQRTGAQNAAQAQLDQLMSGGDITKMPGYKAGEQAIMRSMAAQGYLGSGNMMTALQNFGGDFYNQQARMLAAQAGLQPGQLEAATAGTQLRGQALNSMLYGASRVNWQNLLRQFGALGGGGGDDVPIPTGDEGE